MRMPNPAITDRDFYCSSSLVLALKGCYLRYFLETTGFFDLRDNSLYIFHIVFLWPAVLLMLP